MTVPAPDTVARVSRRDFLILLAIFAASRLVYMAIGLSFDTSLLGTGIQFIDMELLETRLYESLLFYHAKTPLLNGLAALGIKVFGDYASWFYALVFHLLGIGLAVSVFGLTSALQSRRTAWVVVTLIVCSPSFVLYENWFMYTFPACALLTMSAFLLYNYLGTRLATWGIGFFACVTALVLSRALFHFYWLLLVIFILVLVSGLNRRQLLTFAALPLLVCSLWYGKNLYFFGSFSSSSLLGLSLSNISTLMIEKPVLQHHVDAGELSRFAVISRYRDLPRVLNEETLAPETGIPVLDQNKKANGTRNFNSLEMKVVSELYLEDAREVIRRYPHQYVTGVILSHQLFFSPASTSFYFSEDNRNATRLITKIYNPLFYGARTTSQKLEQPHFGLSGRWFVESNTGVTLVLFWLVILFWASWRSLVTIFTGAWSPRNIIIGYMFGNLLLIYAAGTLLEFAENNRYRYIGEPLFWILLVVAVTETGKGARRIWQRLSGSK